MQKYIKILLALLITVSFYSCNKKGKYHINTKHIDIKPVILERFDVGQALMTKENYEQDLEKLRLQYPIIFEFYIEKVAESGRVADKRYIEGMRKFFFDKYTQELYQDVYKKYNDLKWLEEDLTDAFKHLHYYFPDTTLPQVGTIISSFFGSCATYDNHISISLDMYLGKDYKYYPDFFPTYKYTYFTEDYIVSDVMKVWYMKMFPESEYAGNSLLSKMIYRGKMLFFLDIMLPDVHDSIKINYSKDQLKWCNKHEGNIWNQFIENNILHNTEALKISRYIDDAPFTNAYGFPTESPPRLGEWVGWQIVRSYMDKKSGKELIELFFEKDDQNVLNTSGYKPKI